MALFIISLTVLFVIALTISIIVGVRKFNANKKTSTSRSQYANATEYEKAVADMNAYNATMKKSAFRSGFISLIVSTTILCGGFVLAKSIKTISTSSIGVVTLFGQVQDRTLDEGIHLVNPLARVYEITTALDTAAAQNAESSSKDMQSVHTSITVNYRVDASKAKEVYTQNPNLKYEEQFVVPAIYEVLKAVTANYTAEELITKRQEASHRIHEQLVVKLKQYHMTVQDINITNFTFSKTFNEGIEAKVLASQHAEKAQRDLQRIKFEAEQKIVSAKANAQAIKIQTEAINSSGGQAYVQLKAIEKWSGELPQVVGGNGMIPMIDLKAISKKTAE